MFKIFNQLRRRLISKSQESLSIHINIVMKRTKEPTYNTCCSHANYNTIIIYSHSRRLYSNWTSHEIITEMIGKLWIDSPTFVLTNILVLNKSFLKSWKVSEQCYGNPPISGLVRNLFDVFDGRNWVLIK